MRLKFLLVYQVEQKEKQGIHINNYKYESYEMYLL